MSQRKGPYVILEVNICMDRDVLLSTFCSLETSTDSISKHHDTLAMRHALSCKAFVPASGTHEVFRIAQWEP